MRSKGRFQQQPGAQPCYCKIYCMDEERAASVRRRSLRRSTLRMLTPGRMLVVSVYTVSIQAKGTVMDAVRVSASGDFWWIGAKEYHRDHTTQQISHERFIGGVAGE